MKMIWRIGAAAVVIGWVNGAIAAPKIEFDKKTYDFGTTSGVASVTGKFVLKNVGDAELVISKPSTSCGCTVAGVNPDKLKPGESGELTFTLSLGQHRGVVQKNITVPTNDPDNPRAGLTVKVDVMQIFEITPQSVGLGDMRAGSSTNLVVTMKRLDGKPLVIDKVVTPGQRLTAKFQPVEGDDKSAQIHVTAKMGEGLGSFNEQVQVFTDNAAQPTFTITVFGRQVGDVSVAPEKVFWGIPDMGRLPASRLETILTRNIRVTGTVPNQVLQLKSVTSDVKDLDLQVVTIEPSKTYQIVAKLPELPKESSKGTITVETNLASIPKLEVPVQITVVQRK